MKSFMFSVFFKDFIDADISRKGTKPFSSFLPIQILQHDFLGCEPGSAMLGPNDFLTDISFFLRLSIFSLFDHILFMHYLKVVGMVTS